MKFSVPLMVRSPLANYCVASADHLGAAGTGILIPDFAFKENVRITNWTCTLDAESVVIYHSLKSGSERQ